jgi:hypothetical protein
MARDMAVRASESWRSGMLAFFFVFQNRLDLKYFLFRRIAPSGCHASWLAEVTDNIVQRDSCIFVKLNL